MAHEHKFGGNYMMDDGTLRLAECRIVPHGTYVDAIAGAGDKPYIGIPLSVRDAFPDYLYVHDPQVMAPVPGRLPTLIGGRVCTGNPLDGVLEELGERIVAAQALPQSRWDWLLRRSAKVALHVVGPMDLELEML